MEVSFQQTTQHRQVGIPVLVGAVSSAGYGGAGKEGEHPAMLGN